ncbi:5600_t:CDS:1, partial [Cetraspora pellucida]
MVISMNNPSPKKQDVFIKAQNEWKTVKSLDKGIIECKIDGYLKAPLQPIQYAFFLFIPSLTNQSITANEASFLPVSMIELEELPLNATAQRSSLKKQNIAEDRLDELNSLLNVACNPERRHDFL